MQASFSQKFIFDKLPIKGSYVVLDDCWQIIKDQREYPVALQQLMGELLTANVLLTNNVKLDGKVICQIQDNPYFNLVVSECSNTGDVRATAKYTAQDEAMLDYAKCLSAGRLVVSIDSKSDGQMYQSIIAFNGSSVSDILNNYMTQSEQLKTWFMIAYSQSKVVGLMLQQLPDVHAMFSNEIERVFMLAETLTHHELATDKFETILYKLFNEDDVRILSPHSVNFACSCSHSRVAGVLRSLGADELKAIIAEQGSIKVDCDYCNAEYRFSEAELEQFIMQLSVEEMSPISEQIN